MNELALAVSVKWELDGNVAIGFAHALLKAVQD